MLSAFTARPLVELKQRDKSKIESVLAYGDRLLVGLNNGSLRIYRVNEVCNGRQAEDDHHGEGEEGGSTMNNGDSSRPATMSSGTNLKPKQSELLRELEKFSRYKVEQLVLIKEAKLLISLSGGYVSIHDLQTYEFQEQLTRTRGATTFAVTSNIVHDPETGVPSIVSRLAVAVKRKILLWTWRDMELENDTAEMSLVSGIKTLTWVSGTKLVAGLSSNFVMVDIETTNVTDLVGPGSIGGLPGQETGRLAGVGVASMSYIGIGGTAPKPLATRLSEGQVLLAKDINTQFIDIEGNSLGRRQIPWSHAPSDIGYSYPFLLALHDSSKGVLEVRNPETLSLLQSIPLPSASLLHIPQPSISLAHAGKGFLVASDRTIWRMEALSYDTQIDALVEKGYLDEAISLANMLEDALLTDKYGRLRSIKLDKAQTLFSLRKYLESMELFTEISAPPEAVIRLYPRVIAGDLSSIPEEHEGSEAGTTDSQPRPEQEQKQDTVPATSDDAALARTQANTPSVRSLLRTKTDDTSDAGSVRSKLMEDSRSDKRLEGKDLKLAVRELQAYLADVRRRFQRFLNPDGSLKMDPTADVVKDEFTESVMKLLEMDKDQGEDDFGERLRAKAKLVDTTLFRVYMYATPSLAGSLFRIANFCDPDVVIEKLEESGRQNDLIDFLYGKKMHRQALELLKKFGQAEVDGETASQLQGPKRTVGYLQNLSPEHIDLILEFAEWPIREKPDLGMEIFLADTENAETLPRHQVLGFLKGIDVRLAVRYLEHVIGELNDMTPDLHQSLLSLYLDRLEEQKNKEWEFASEEDRTDWRNKLLDMLRTSSQYSPAKILDRLNRDDPEFFEARAIVFSKMGQHRQALEIYVFKLEDYTKAEEYCNHLHKTEDATSKETTAIQNIALPDFEGEKPSIYLTLLSLYLSPPHGYKPRYGPALEVLAKHGSRLPPNSALELIPETLPVKELQFYFKGRMRAATSILNESRIVANMQKSQSIKTQAQLLVGEGGDVKASRSRHVTITEERICGICHKRLGGSVINVFPE
ncbi:putative vacuolar morphogenesis protein AvaB [Aspergillus fischeri NRRL 181]|uniref:Vacuolar morphogenesis protein AvaB, putative n=1 Tax=Neosartorya fischeri (strain ATCC 1020 / DSM 3700 / CBS 544.65 / FGSC A1164 / JCM 1740 / NRRL 181 / WB 181) TaxID=331117 RepID=A1DCR9_NEOFI|nr:vacuolar morphogenesis protein AvaB, putative [Aspergillus fischeri NRRL 181]EAW19629.1 vacuolar morphogenesis protein AvaB, putative [Aspergillus fischeri NRRL 181]